MGCPFEEETDCCARCGASAAKYRAADHTCQDHGAGVVHLDRRIALRHRRHLAPLVEQLRTEAARLAREAPPPMVDSVFDLYAAVPAAEPGDG